MPTTDTPVLKKTAIVIAQVKRKSGQEQLRAFERTCDAVRWLSLEAHELIPDACLSTIMGEFDVKTCLRVKGVRFSIHYSIYASLDS